MRTPNSKLPLRDQLRAAVEARDRMLSNGWSLRKDPQRVRVAMGKAQAFLASYPVADDQRVRNWCTANLDELALIVPGNWPTAFGRLVMDELKKRGSVPTNEGISA